MNNFSSTNNMPPKPLGAPARHTPPAPIQSTPPPPASPATPAITEKAKRVRKGLSTEKQLAIAIAGLVALFSALKIQLTPEQTAQIKAADTLAKELNQKTIAPIQKRIAEIKTEFEVISKDFLAPGNAVKAKDLAGELAKLQTKLQELTKPATTTAPEKDSKAA